MNEFNNEITETQIERIKVMSKLAIYDKHFGEDDKKANDLYYRDYVYRKNFNYRMSFFIAYVMAVSFYVLITFLDPGIDLYNFDFLNFVTEIAIGAAVVLFAATFIGSIVASGDYKKIKYRLKGYFTLMSLLESLDNEDKKREIKLQKMQRRTQRKEVNRNANVTRGKRDNY